MSVWCESMSGGEGNVRSTHSTPETRSFPIKIGQLACLILILAVLTACATDSGTSRQRTGTEPAVRTSQENFNTAISENGGAPILSYESIVSLQQAEQRYREIAASSGWPTIQPGGTFRPGDGDPRNTGLVRRLAASGDLVLPAQGRVHAQQAAAALASFQSRHGLKPTGVADAETVTQLNVSAEARLEQLRINLARLRDQVAKTAKYKRYVVVNIPSFELAAVDGSVVSRRHRVIVGRPERQTPSVHAFIQNINFHPVWHVPESIARSDIIPLARADAGYIDKMRLRVLKNDQIFQHQAINWQLASSPPLSFEQEAGPWNALGVMRFDMPNEHAVYLHDTPMKDLFTWQQRAFSAGCVRVENVIELGAWVLRDTPGWDRQRIEAVVAQSQPRDVKVAAPVPVIFVYLTAWADISGRINFRPDLYGHDGMADRLGISQSAAGSTTTGFSLAP